MSQRAQPTFEKLARSLALLAEGQRALGDMLVGVSLSGLGPAGNATFSKARQRFEQIETTMIDEGLLTPRVR